jgi:hypothetical protein
LAGGCTAFGGSGDLAFLIMAIGVLRGKRAETWMVTYSAALLSVHL